MTFTDQLGDYMRVTKMNSIVFAGKKYEQVSSQDLADGSTKYTFAGSVEANEIYKAAELSKMDITVKHSEGRTGDLVTVNVPEELLPLRLYKTTVDKDGNVTTEINRTNPMRLFYEVALKDDVTAKVAQPDAQMSEYIANHTDDDGNVRFYTNAYDKAVNGANGATTAVFTPAQTNDFYYFTQDTPLYNSKDLNDPATSIDAAKPYYYQRTYYANNAKHEQWIDVLGKNADGKAVADKDGHYYAPAGTTRTGLSRLYTAAKTDNTTETAANAIAPHWEMSTVTVNLGNNGMQKIAMPGALMVTERVVWPEGTTPDPDKEFPFTLELPEPAGARAAASYQATIAGRNVTVQNGSTFSLKDGETAAVYGLPAGMRAKAVQTDHGGAGWSVNHAEDMGDIKRNETTQLGFVNTYALEPTTLEANAVKGTKTLVGRDWQPDESFTFQMKAGDANPDAPMPNPAAVTVTNAGGKDGDVVPFGFGAITYDKPGTYQYVITETAGMKAGMRYSGASYIATVTVKDNGDGTMSASAALTNTFGDDGVHIEDEPEAASADFTNTFLGNNDAVATIRGIKHYTDDTGTKPNNKVGTFNVMITPAEGNPEHGPTFDGTVPVGIDGTWPCELKFTNEALNGQHEQTFTYHVREVVPAGVDDDNPTQNGMTYDVNTYDVQITVSRDEQQNLITKVTYPDGGERVELKNSYRAADTKGADLRIAKKVTGHGSNKDQFTFNARLTAGDAANVKIKQTDDKLADWTNDRTATAPALDKDQTGTVDFGTIVFTMPGTYTFQMREQLPDGVSAANPTKDGWTYDTHTHTVTYEVTDNNGQLEAERNTDGHDLFTNTYAASVEYGAAGTADGFRIGKTLDGRPMNAQEFTFEITPVDGAPMPNGVTSVRTSNPFSALNGQELVWPASGTLLAGLRFTQDTVGTYRYTVREVAPEGVTKASPTKDGVTYDFTEHTVSIEVTDNGDGTMTTKTTVDGNDDAVARFVNKYEAAAGKQSFELTKTVNGRDWKDDESFTFDLTPNEGQSSVSKDVLTKAMPARKSQTVDKPSGNTAQFGFGEFTFSQAGTYVYNVTEQQGGTTDKGLTYDGRTAVVSFTVVDSGLGRYVAGKPLITGIGEANTFANVYTSKEFTGVPTGMAFSKELAGTEWTADRAFDFTIEAVTDGAPLPEQTTFTVGKPADGNKADFTFGDITYTKTGTYEYTVHEVQGNMPGVSYDTHTAKVTVTVTDDGNGQLEAKAIVTEGAFSNTYTAKPSDGVPAGMVFSKQLTGIDWPQDREFEFTLEGKDESTPMPAETKVSVGKPAEGDTVVFDFGAIRYEKAGEYEYTVKETKGDMPGVSYATNVATVKVTVSDNGQGQLEATAVVTDGTFVNTYGTTPSGGVPEGMTFIKQLTGIDWPADRSFEFTLTGEDNAPMPEGAKDGKLNVKVGKPAEGDAAVFDFGAITYNAEGTYKYTVTEVPGDMSGVAYAKNTATVTVTVKDDKQGKLIATAAVEGNVFANEYSAKEFTGVPAGMAFSKELTGIDWPQDREFEFTLEAVTEDAPMPSGAKVSVGKPDKGNKADFAFGDITYTTPGVYEYTVKETKGDMPGVSYDDRAATVKVEVKDNHKGQLEATATVTAGAFTNTYTAQQVTVGSAELKLSKQLTGIDWPKDRDFEFTIEAAKGTPMPEHTTATVGKPADGDTAAIDFGTITYDKAGVYEYTVKETKGDMPGVAYADGTAKVTVTVTDNKRGNLVAKVDVTDGTFVNTYTADPFDGVPTGMESAFSKQLTGIAWPKDRDFEFTIEAAEGTPMPRHTTISVGKPADGDTAKFDFGAIRYDKAGVYKYTVKETKGDMPGVTYDGHTATVVVEVTDNHKGQLEATATVTDAAFVNAYKANEVTVGSADMNLSKQLTGIAWPDGRSFDFTIEAVTKDAPMPQKTTATVGKPANGSDTASFGFGTITYTKAGTYTYKVTETKGDMPGVAYADGTAEVTVTVTDKGNGQLKAEVNTTGGTFVNTYKVEEFNGVPTGMAFSKQLTGIDWPADRRFTFSLTGADGAPMPEGAQDGVLTKSVGKPAEGDTAKFDFGAITYTQEGTYTYTVKELAGIMPGVAFDDHEAKVTVTVKDDKQGHLIATAVVDKAAFVNTYTANEFNGVPTGMAFSKQLTGTEWGTREFTFTLTGVDGAPMPAETTVKVGKPANGDSADFQFGAIQYTKAGTYTYHVTEHNDGIGGIAYDDHTATVTVEVTDNNRGQLVATATVKDGKFENTYSATPFDGVPTDMRFSKELTGIDWPKDREFEFTLEAVDGAPMPKIATTTVGKPANGTTAAFDFGAIRYEQAGTYRYTVRESAGDMPGVTYDDHMAHVTVDVTDNGNGELEAVATVTDGAFVNVYGTQPSDGVPEGMTFIKQLDGIAWPKDRTFDFTLTAEGDAPMPKGAKDGKIDVSVGKPGDGGTAVFDFGAITYTAEGTYKYTVAEVAGDMPGVAYAKNTATVTVTVKDDKQGNLVATAEVTGGVFTNTYSTSPFDGVPTSMAFSKQLTGIDWPKGRDFEFTLEAVTKDAPMPADTVAKAVKPADGDTANFRFGAIRYDKPGVYEYTVKETKGDMPGVSYDGHTAHVKVTVTDDGEGKLVATADVTGAAFVNGYEAAAFEGVPTGMAFSKQLTGIAWPEDRTFEFTLEADTKDAPMPAKTKISVGKPAEGDTAGFGFGSIRYEQAGTYEYTVKETRGNMPGVAYDYHTSRITVTVTDDGSGKLAATADVTDGTFVNTYSAEPATGVPTDFTLVKRVEGMAWSENQKFEFTLHGQDGAPMPKHATVTVGKPADGDSASFDFGEIVFDRAGVYKYTVTEIAGDQPGMVYDGHTATITVDVADDGEGHLVTAATVVNGLFTNRYSTQNVAYPGVDVTEDLTGRAQAQGEFGFTVTGSDEDMRRAGFATNQVTHAFAAAASGETVTVPGLFTGLELTHDDVRAGTRFTYEVDQTGAQSGNGLTVDDQVYTVQIWATDNGDGTMHVHTSINGVETNEPTPVLPFHNVYATTPVTIGGDAEVRINAHKTLHGRDLNAGEFHFAVRDAKGAQLAGGTNAADGTVTFDAIEFTDARLNADVKSGIVTATINGKQTVYRYAATVDEITDALPAGVTALASGFAVALVITDNGDGQLSANVEYPTDTNGVLNFVNQYGAASEVGVGMNGTKVLAVASGNNPPDITGKYTFTIAGSEGAPMPQRTTVTNDAAGAVDFGTVTYTVANVFGDNPKTADEAAADADATSGADADADADTDANDAQSQQPTTREKTFTYTVTESGTVAGVTNDASAQRTITVRVVDNGDGTLTVDKQPAAAGTDFTFTNTYGVQPTDPTSPTDTNVKGGVPLTKTLDGREMREGEFSFELIEAASGNVVGSATNAADGSVHLPGVVFDAPGSYAYLVRELAGTTGGVTYDTRVYAAVATVVDNGDGTLGVSWTVTAPAIGVVDAMTFENTYTAQPTNVQISAGKMLLGRELKEGEFSFVLTALNSAPMPHGAQDGVQTVANDANGNAKFGAIDYTKAGDFEYTVSEVKGDAEGVTYDTTEHHVTVHVVDDDNGALNAQLQYADGAEGIVFHNTYTKPEEPVEPDTPKPTPSTPTPSPTQPTTPTTPTTPTKPITPSTGGHHYSGSTSTPNYHVGSVASTGSAIAIIVAAAAVLLAAGVGLLLARKHKEQ